MPTNTPESWWNQTEMPQGIEWYSYPTERPGYPEYGIVSITGIATNASNYAERIATFREWIETNDLRVVVHRSTDFFTSGTYVSWPTKFLVSRLSVEEMLRYWTLWEPYEAFTCDFCGAEHQAYAVMCHETDLPLNCQMCRSNRSREGVRLARADMPATGFDVLCEGCGHSCEDCSTLVTGELVWCSEHGTSASCVGCGFFMQARSGDGDWSYTETGEAVCANCESRICGECHSVSRHNLTWSDDADTYVCRNCFRSALLGVGEEFDAGAAITARELRIPTIPGRENIRLCGVEIEGANGTENGEELARAFVDYGLSTRPSMVGYHHGNGAGFAHVESDSSVDWEAVIGPLNPADRGDVQRLNRVMRAIRERVHDGRLSLDLRAGCHIHVGAERTSLDGAFNLATLFAYTEDVIFRLAAAKWPVHRALQGSDYAQPIPKESRKLEFARSNNEDGSRYYALSFQNYFSQMLGNCRCGAVRYDSWEDCTCDLGKCTFEFRVFNTTANPRKLHAYLALAQALVAKAMSLGKINDLAAQLPAHGFIHRRFKDMRAEEQAALVEEWQERLTWMFTELPLTDAERESLHYCVINSELANVGETFINELVPAAPEQQVIEEVVA